MKTRCQRAAGEHLYQYGLSEMPLLKYAQNPFLYLEENLKHFLTLPPFKLQTKWTKQMDIKQFSFIFLPNKQKYPLYLNEQNYSEPRVLRVTSI